MQAATDCEGNLLRRNVSKDRFGPYVVYGANVWFGSRNATNLKRYLYRLRKDAERADISDTHILGVVPYKP